MLQLDELLVPSTTSKATYYEEEMRKADWGKTGEFGATGFFADSIPANMTGTIWDKVYPLLTSVVSGFTATRDFPVMDVNRLVLRSKAFFASSTMDAEDEYGKWLAFLVRCDF